PSTWWVDVLAITDYKELGRQWNNGPGNGDFLGPVANPNYLLVDGLLPSIMTCPASDLPNLNDPSTDISPANRTQVAGAQGIAIPAYVAMSGSAPDMRGLTRETWRAGAHGRNTRDD